MNRAKAFSLIELMVVVIIIGILAAIAIPSYNKYALNAKYAEAYVTIEAIQKAQLKHFTEHGYFLQTSMLGSYGVDGASGYIESKGKKLTIDLPTTGMGARYDWMRLGSPIASGSANFFAYVTWAGYWDPTGISYIPHMNVDVFEILAQDLSGDNGTFKIAASTVDVDPARCGELYSAEQLGVQQANGKHFVIILAGANFTEDEGVTSTCAYVSQNLQTNSDGVVSVGPLTTINYGQ